MSVYMIAHATVDDPEAYKAYLEAAPAFVKKYGGEYLVRGGKVLAQRGEWNPERLLIFRFPSQQAIEDFMADPDYQPWKELRERVTTPHSMLIIEGVKDGEV
jgi:uncharacterized protein (DUF1330 family)